jgi:hypothetical protein
VLKQPELAALKNPRWPVYFRSPPGRGRGVDQHRPDHFGGRRPARLDAAGG